MEDMLGTFEGEIERADVALFHFAGHGLQVDGQNYLIPIDVELRQETHLRRRTFNLNEQFDLVTRNAGASLLFLDACRENPFTRSLQAGMNSAAQGRLIPRSGRWRAPESFQHKLRRHLEGGIDMVVIPAFRFVVDALSKLAKQGSAEFKDNSPFPHLPTEIASAIASEFPKSNEINWRIAGPGAHSGDKDIEKITASNEELFPPPIRHVMHEFNSNTFQRFVEQLTGFSGSGPVLPRMWAPFNRSWREVDATR